MATLLVACFVPGHAADLGPYTIDVQLDVRAAFLDSPYRTSLDGGLGLLRFDEEHDGLRLGRLLANFNGPLTETVRADLTLSATDDGDQNIIDVTEAYLEWRPYPRSDLRWRSRVGAFYPPISLENRAVGWQSPYSITPSGINTWVGEEFRAIGIEQTLTLLSAASRRNYEIGFVAGAYGWNDPAGVLILQRGWALNDRQTPLFGALPRPLTNMTAEPIRMFREIDHRIGYYAGAEYKYAGRHVFRVLRYDNRGDPSKSAGADSAWRTRFNAIGWRSELPTQTTLIAQAMDGDTAVGSSADGRGALILEYWSYFVLASQSFGAHRVTARYDRLYTEPVRVPFDFSEQSAIAWTLAYQWDLNRTWQFVIEGLRISGALAQRGLIGQNPHGVENMLQVAARFSL
jgi:hypothetical protein